MRKLSFVLVALACAVWIFAPPAITQEDPWWRPLNPYGTSAGVTYGTQAPALATTGQNPAPGELWVDTDGASDGGAMLLVYNATAVAWQSPGTQIGAAGIIFEGATADAFETTLNVVDPTADHAITLPNDTGTAILSTLATNEQDAANSIWGGTNQLIFESTAVDAFEYIFEPAALTGDVTVTLPSDNADWAGTGAPVYSVLLTNAPDAANSIWGVANGLHFEGATPDLFEGSLQMADMGQDTVAYFGEMTEAIQSVVMSTVDNMDRDGANSVWFEPDQLWFEGTGVDAFEIVLEAEDSTVGVDTYVLSDRALAADSYDVIAPPDGERNTANLFYGEYTDAVAAAANADNVLLVKRAFVPQPVVVTHVDVLNNDLANASAGDNTIAVSIYYDADAGVQIVELVGATDDGAGAATGLYTLDIADTTLHPGWYRFAFCAQDASDNDIELHQVDADILLIWGAGAATGEMTATGANPCVAGDPPDTTGALTQVADNMVFMLRTQ